MARFTKTWKDGLFMGWDSCAPGSKCTEATMKEDLCSALDPIDAENFKQLEPGAAFTTQYGTAYFREW